MKSDIYLQKGSEVLIIDVKYYSHNLQEQFDKVSAKSAHLYQIFTYVKNKEEELKNIEGNKVSGILLYAKTIDEIQPNSDYQMRKLQKGNKNEY